MEFQEKFIAFIDILGFKNLVHAAENDGSVKLQDITQALKYLGSREDITNIKTYGPRLCPESACINKDINLQITQVSDCAIISSEISPLGIINLVNHCWGAAMNLLMKGFLCRGYITRGSIYHTDLHFIGSGYQDAFSKESEVSAFKQEVDDRGTPYIEVDQNVCNYIEGLDDKCVKEMFSRLTKEDGDTTVLFPFKRLGHSFVLMGGFDPIEEKESNNNVRLLIKKLKSEITKYIDTSNPKAVLKSRHYIAALDAQLEACDRTDRIIEMWS